MIKRFFAPLAFVAVLISIFSFTNKWKQKPALKTIIVDPGHGGYDIGARGQFSTEAEVSLAIALRVGKKLEAEFPDCNIVYTRKGKALPGNLNDLNEANHLRAQMANEAKGDLFISIHCNSAGLKAGGWNARRISGYRTKKTGYRQRQKEKDPYRQDANLPELLRKKYCFGYRNIYLGGRPQRYQKRVHHTGR